VGDTDIVRGIPGRGALNAHIAFDLDGTLVDSVGDLAASASELVTTLGGRPLHVDEVALMVGDGAGVLVRRALHASGLDPETPGALARFLEIYDRRLLDTTTAYEGVVDMLLLASRHARLSVLTNKPLAPSRRILDALGLSSYFEDVIGGDHTLGRKPAPAALHALARGAEHVMLVGDSPVDDETAAAANCDFVWARYGFGAERFEQPPSTPYVLERPADFAAVLDRARAIRSG
jgi:phosphoglycolate phosphatase